MVVGLSMDHQQPSRAINGGLSTIHFWLVMVWNQSIWLPLGDYVNKPKNHPPVSPNLLPWRFDLLTGLNHKDCRVETGDSPKLFLSSTPLEGNLIISLLDWNSLTHNRWMWKEVSQRWWLTRMKITVSGLDMEFISAASDILSGNDDIKASPQSCDKQVTTSQIIHKSIYS